MTKTFVKKPISVQAIQWTGHNYAEIVDFVGKDGVDLFYSCEKSVLVPMLVIYAPSDITDEGDHLVRVGNWIIKGIKGEFYPCKPDVFEQTYEEVN